VFRRWSGLLICPHFSVIRHRARGGMDAVG
jgi:hypothetical protein